MKSRYNLTVEDVEGFNEMFKLETYCDAIEWLKPLSHLIKIRASQINKCVYCINMHTNEAITAGESLKRIVLLNAWTEASVFTDKEKLVLEITEALTLISQNGVPDALYEKASQIFTDKEIAQIAMIIGLINLWNRVVITSGVREVG